MKAPTGRSLILCVALAASAGCARLRTNKYPAFDDTRVERVGEPVTVITTNVHSIQIEPLGDERSVQAMPVLMIRRRQSGITWSSLVGHVKVPDISNPPTNTGRKIYLVGEITEGRRDSTGVRRFDVSQTFSLEQMKPAGLAADDIARREKEFLATLDADTTWRVVPMLLVCIPPSRAEQPVQFDPRCFHSGHRYRLEIGNGQPQAVYPFRVENRNGLLGIAVGLTAIAAFVVAEVK